MRSADSEHHRSVQDILCSSVSLCGAARLAEADLRGSRARGDRPRRRVVAARGGKHAAVIDPYGPCYAGEAEQQISAMMIQALLERGTGDGTLRADISTGELGFLLGGLSRRVNRRHPVPTVPARPPRACPAPEESPGETRAPAAGTDTPAEAGGDSPETTGRDVADVKPDTPRLLPPRTSQLPPKPPTIPAALTKTIASPATAAGETTAAERDSRQGHCCDLSPNRRDPRSRRMDRALRAERPVRCRWLASQGVEGRRADRRLVSPPPGGNAM